MKILLVHKFWRKVGGAEVYFQDVARILRNQGHEVMIYTTDLDVPGSRDVFPRDEKVIFGEAAEYLQGGFFQRMKNIPEIIYSVKNKHRFRQLLGEFRPDVVHVFAIYITITPSILDACREAGVPVVMSCNDYKHICPNYRLFHHGHLCEDCKGGKFYHAFFNNCSKHSLAVSLVSAVEGYVHHYFDIWKKNVNLFLFESRFMMNKTEEFWGKGTAQLRFLGKPFHAPAFNCSDRDDGYVLYLGRLSDEKGVDILLRAMKLVPEARLKITGTGSEEQRLREMVVSEGLQPQVEFTGALWGDDLETLIHGCRFMVVPSLWYENFPYVMIEAYARGKAVIGSDKGGIPEYIIPGETGWVFPSHDAQTLAGHIRDLFQHPGKAKSMGQKAKEYADREFRDEVFYNRLSAIYKEATGKS